MHLNNRGAESHSRKDLAVNLDNSSQHDIALKEGAKYEPTPRSDLSVFIDHVIETYFVEIETRYITVLLL